MRTVQRKPIPRILADHEKAWTKQLLAEVARCKKLRKKVDDEFFDKYRDDEVRDTLRTMYGSFCCYCEGRMNIVSYAHIEHRMPKRQFPEKTYCWDNLHLACHRCNIKKGIKWNPSAPILDACVDKVDEHLTYKVSETGIRRWPENDSKRGETTIEHARLNRHEDDDLPAERTKIFLVTLDTIQAANELHRELPDSPTAREMVRELRAKCRDQFGSVIAWAMRHWLDQELAEVRD